MCLESSSLIKNYLSSVARSDVFRNHQRMGFGIGNDCSCAVKGHIATSTGPLDLSSTGEVRRATLNALERPSGRRKLSFKVIFPRKNSVRFGNTGPAHNWDLPIVATADVIKTRFLWICRWETIILVRPKVT